MNARAGSVLLADWENNMTIEHVKAFGTWLSNMLYWVLEPVLGKDANDLAVGAVPVECNTEADMDDLTATYASRTEAIASGGAGMSVGGGVYI